MSNISSFIIIGDPDHNLRNTWRQVLKDRDYLAILASGPAEAEEHASRMTAGLVILGVTWEESRNNPMEIPAYARSSRRGGSLHHASHRTGRADPHPALWVDIRVPA